MAHYVITANTPLATKLRNAINTLQGAMNDLIDVQAALATMTATQATAIFGFSDGINAATDDVATAAKTELAADIPFLGSGQQSGLALQQMLNQFAG